MTRRRKGSPSKRLPDELVMAALEMAEWALAPVILPGEKLADDEAREHLDAVIAQLPPKLREAFLVLLDPPPPRPSRRRRRDTGGTSLDMARLSAVVTQQGMTVDELARAVGVSDAVALMEAPFYDPEGGPCVRSIAKHLGIPTTRICSWDTYDPDWHEGRPTSWTIDRWRFMFWRREFNYSSEALAQDMGISVEEIHAIDEHRADATWLFVERAGMAFGISPPVFSRETPLPSFERADGRYWQLSAPGLADALENEEWIPPDRQFSVEDWAALLAVSVEELDAVCNGATPDPELARRIFLTVPKRTSPVFVARPVPTTA